MLPGRAQAATGRSQASRGATHRAGGPLVDLKIAPTLLTPAQLSTVLGDAQRAGATVVSTGIGWASTQPTAASRPQWQAIDTFVDAARARGLQVRLQISQMPTWARGPGSPAGLWTPPRSPAEVARFASFAGAVAAHFAVRVSYLEVWNEENGTSFWPTGPSPSQYARLLIASYRAIKSAAPAIQVISGGLDRNDVGYLADLYAAITASVGHADAVAHHYYFDLLGAHPYSGNRAPGLVAAGWDHRSTFGAMDENFTGFAQLHGESIAVGDSAKRIYIGEYGFSTAEWSGFAPVPDSVRAGYLTQAYTVAARYSYVVALSWYTLQTTPWDSPGFALLDSSLRPTATFEALVSYARARGMSR